MDGVFFYPIEIENDVPISLSYVKEIFEEIAEEDAHRIYSDLSIKKYPEIIGIFPSLKKDQDSIRMRINT